jgi:hypothetical protein
MKWRRFIKLDDYFNGKTGRKSKDKAVRGGKLSHLLEQTRYNIFR